MPVSLPYAGQAPGNITQVDQPDFLAILVVRRALEGSTRLDGYIAVLKLRSWNGWPGQGLRERRRSFM
jgi:hypothetical protein